MRTKTISAIIDPIATAVAQLIVIVTDAEASKNPFPDLRAAAKVLGEQTINLIQLGKEVGSQPSTKPELRRKMEKSCDNGTTPSATTHIPLINVV
jgi:hypothetical protein